MKAIIYTVVENSGLVSTTLEYKADDATDGSIAYLFKTLCKIIRDQNIEIVFSSSTRITYKMEGVFTCSYDLIDI